MKWIGERISFLEDKQKATFVIYPSSTTLVKSMMGAWFTMWMVIGGTIIWSYFTFKLTDQETIIIYEPTTFKRKKFCVLYLNSKIPQIISISSFIGLNFIQVFSLYKLLLGLYYFKFIAPIFWGYLSLLIMRINIKVNKNREHIIIKINLLKDGNTCEIVTLRRKFKIDLNLSLS